MSLRDDLKAARLLIATPDTWCRGTSAILDAETKVVRRCAVGAAMHAVDYDGAPCGDGPTPARDVTERYAAMCAALSRSAEALYGDQITPHAPPPVVAVNDFIGHEAVLAVYDRAITLADV